MEKIRSSTWFTQITCTYVCEGFTNVWKIHTNNFSHFVIIKNQRHMHVFIFKYMFASVLLTCMLLVVLKFSRITPAFCL